MVLPTGLANPAIKKKKMQDSAAQVGGPAGGGFVADSVAQLAQGEPDSPSAPDAGTADAGAGSVHVQNNSVGKQGDAAAGANVGPSAAPSPASPEGVQSGRDTVANQNREVGKMGANLPSAVPGQPVTRPSQNPDLDDGGSGDQSLDDFYDYNDAVGPGALAGQNIEENSLDELAYLRALGLMGGGNPVTDEELANTRAAANRAGADEVRRMRALFGGSGFGAGGLAGSTISDAAISGALQTEQAVMDLKAAGRQEQLQNILAGAQLGQSQRGSRVDAERNRLVMEILRDEYLGDEDPYSSGTQEGEDRVEDAAEGKDFGTGAEGFSQEMADAAFLDALAARDSQRTNPFGSLMQVAQDTGANLFGIGGKWSGGLQTVDPGDAAANGTPIGSHRGQTVYRMPDGSYAVIGDVNNT